MRVFQYIYKVNVKILLLAAILLAGCDTLHDNREGCELFLKFRYDYNLANEDWFAQQVEQVQVFVFDTQKRYVTSFAERGSVLKDPAYRMQIPYGMKGYTLVAWAGRTADFYHIPSMSPGDPIGKLTLSYLPENQISNQKIDNLWHSGPTEMTFSERAGSVQTVSLLRETNDFSFTLQNSAGKIPVKGYTVRINAANGAYHHDNSFWPDCQTIHYSTYGSSEDNTTAYLRTLRLVDSADVTFSVIETATGKPLDIGGKTEINLIDYLLMSIPSGMEKQEYLDRRYLWEINLNIDQNAYIALSITINNWTHWFHPTELN